MVGYVIPKSWVLCSFQIVVYDDTCSFKRESTYDESFSGSFETCKHLARILEYLECPQYLRKYLFPMCDELKFVGLLNPLDAPHHLRASEECPYRYKLHYIFADCVLNRRFIFVSFVDINWEVETAYVLSQKLLFICFGFCLDLTVQNNIGD